MRDSLGQGTEAPLVTDGRGEFFVRLTRAGWRNPAQLPRGTLQRVQYRLEDEELIRESWVVLDSPLGVEPRSEVLIDGVEELRIEYLDGEDDWSESWPPLRRTSGAGAGGPRAARITLTPCRLGRDPAAGGDVAVIAAASHRQSGIAALTAMLVVALATVLAVELLWNTSLDLRRTQNLLERDQAIKSAWAWNCWRANCCGWTSKTTPTSTR